MPDNPTGLDKTFNARATGQRIDAMTTYIFFRDLAEISVQEVGFKKYYNVKGFSMPDWIMQNASRHMTENTFWNFSSRIGDEL